MLKIYAGLYHDQFCDVAYKVFRATEPAWGSRPTTGWRYQVDGGMHSPLYGRKDEATQAARREIDRRVAIVNGKVVRS